MTERRVTPSLVAHDMKIRHSCCEKLEAYENLDPAAYRACVEALRMVVKHREQWQLKMHGETFHIHDIFKIAEDALTRATTPEAR